MNKPESFKAYLKEMLDVFLILGKLFVLLPIMSITPFMGIPVTLWLLDVHIIVGGLGCVAGIGWFFLCLYADYRWDVGDRLIGL